MKTEESKTKENSIKLEEDQYSIVEQSPSGRFSRVFFT